MSKPDPYKPEDIYEPEMANDDDMANYDSDSSHQRERKRRRKSRWGDKEASLPPPNVTTMQHNPAGNRLFTYHILNRLNGLV